MAATNSIQDAESNRSPTNGALAALQGCLECPICSEVLDAAVVSSACGHAYCSLCVRRWMQVREECPKCRRSLQESFIVACPILEDCARIISPLPEQRVKAASTISPQELKERPPSLSLSGKVTSDAQLATALKAQGFPVHGGRKWMVFRYREFKLRMKARVDSSAPKTKRQIVKDVLEEERLSGGAATGLLSMAVGTSMKQEDEQQLKTLPPTIGAVFQSLTKQLKRERALRVTTPPETSLAQADSEGEFTSPSSYMIDDAHETVDIPSKRPPEGTSMDEEPSRLLSSIDMPPPHKKPNRLADPADNTNSNNDISDQSTENSDFFQQVISQTLMNDNENTNIDMDSDDASRGGWMPELSQSRTYYD